MATPQNRSQVPVGTVLEGKFRILREIGRGGMAAVYEAENMLLGKHVAVKILAAELITSRIVRERFLREARAAAAIRSPYICDVYDSGMYDGRPFLVMEFLEGESLYDLLTRVRRLDADTTLQIVTQAARGLGKAHDANVIHRDLKPENIFVTKTTEGDTVVKLLDFGLAKFYEQTDDKAVTRLTREGALFGTPAYMSPEQAKGQGEVDHRADLWALGCIVYECVTGTTVWNVDQGVAMILAQIAGAPLPKPSKLRPDLPLAFDAWFARALERDPSKRPQNAKDFAESLAIALKTATSIPPPAWRVSSEPSAEEGAMVDDLVKKSQHHIATPKPHVHEGTPPTGGTVDVPGPMPAQQTGLRWRTVGLLLAAAALAVGAYAVWLYVLHPPQTVASPVDAGAASASAAPSAALPREVLKPMEKDPLALQLQKGQVLLRDGKGEAALAQFKEAFNNGGVGVARGFLNHAAVAVPGSGGPCKVTGLGRPRPFELVSPSSRPSIAVGKLGALVAWVDNHQDPSRRQAFTALLDDALRRVSPARLVTPEANSVRFSQLVSAGDRIALVYWDDAGNSPGVYARMLDDDGRIAGPAKRLSPVKRHDFYPALTRAEDGSFWAAWEDNVDDGTDLVTRHLTHELEPKGEPSRLTAFAMGRSGHGPEASRPDVSVVEGQINVVFALEREKKWRIYLLQVGTDDPTLPAGVTRQVPKPGKKKEDKFIGRLIQISTNDRDKHVDPRIVCNKEHCYIVWSEEKGGAFAALLDRKKGQTLWHREFSRKGSAPSLTDSPNGAMVVWYEASRVKLASMTRDGLEPASVLAKVGGFQPFASIAAGTRPGEWYISWRDYESGHLENFVVRAQCQ
jgi:serine/threonine-protein kinase